MTDLRSSVYIYLYDRTSRNSTYVDRRYAYTPAGGWQRVCVGRLSMHDIGTVPTLLHDGVGL